MIDTISPWWLAETQWLRSVAESLNTMPADQRSAVLGTRPQVTTPRRDDGQLAVIHIVGGLTKYASWFSRLFGGTSYVDIRKAIASAAADPHIAALLLIVDSPGGQALGCRECAMEVSRAAAKKPTFAYVDDLAASGGYYLVSQATKIFSGLGSMIGSIGTVMRVVDSSEAMRRLGIQVHRISSAPLKGIETPGAPVNEADLQELQRIVDELTGQFIGDVARGRRKPIDRVKKEWATGQIFTASHAKALGLIDHVVPDGLPEAVARIVDHVHGISGVRMLNAVEIQGISAREEVIASQQQQARSEFESKKRRQQIRQWSRRGY